jgi:hypothetical protein
MNETELFEKKLFPIVIQLIKDRVSNVRMNCAIILKNIQTNNKDILREANTAKDELKKDADMDILNALE